MSPNLLRPKGGPKGDEDPVARMIDDKHQEYVVGARRYQALYYATRLVSGLCAGLLPFALRDADPRLPFYQSVPTLLSLAVVVATVFDLVFGPKDKWALYSKATDLMAIARIRAAGRYEEYAESLELILNTETALLQQVMNLGEMVGKIEAAKPK